jgi:hypothetical protein
MDEQFNFTKQYRKILILAMAGGLLISIIAIFIFKLDASRIWANVLLNNQFFLGISLGGAFFLAVHRIGWSGWHTVLQRIPDAMTTYLPVAFILMLLVYFGMNDIYHWSHYEGHAAILEGKKGWLNTPFFFIRVIFYFSGWIVLLWLMRKNSNMLMTSADIKYHNRRKVFAGLFLAFYAITVSTSSWDWIMSLDAHWFSTLFGWYVFIGMFVTSLAFIILLVWFLKRVGYLDYVKVEHIHNLSNLLLAFSIFWAYLWFSQYLLIWFGHIPEETIYFITRLEDFKIIFFLNLGLNFVVPFFALMRFESKRQIGWVAIIAAIVLIGHWIDYYQMIMPAAVGENSGIGVLEIFMTIFYASIFLFIVLRSLSIGPFIVKNDPFIEESLNYES